MAITLTAPPHDSQVSISISPKAPIFGEYSIEAPPQGAYFLLASVFYFTGYLAQLVAFTPYFVRYQPTLLVAGCEYIVSSSSGMNLNSFGWAAKQGESGKKRANRVRLTFGWALERPAW